MRLIVTPSTILRWQRDIVRRRWATLSRRSRSGRLRRTTRCGRWCCDWPGRTSRGNAGGSTASSRDSASRWRRPRSGRSSRAPGSTGLRAGWPGLGGVPPVPGTGDPGTGLLRRRPAQRQEGLRPYRHRARRPAHPDRRSHRASGLVAGSAASPEPARGPGRRRDTGKVHTARRDASFTATFDSVLQAAGIRVIRSAVQAPRMNSLMERWTGSCRRELLDRTLVWNQRHLMIVLRESGSASGRGLGSGGSR